MKISEIIEPQRVAIDQPLASKKAVLEKLAEMLSSADTRLNHQEVFNSLVARERLGTTGLGEGIAIPHGRVPTQASSIGAFVRTAEPINFDAVDNAPVDLFFALCVPEDATDEHLKLLSALATRFSDREVVAELRTCSSLDDVIGCLANGDGSAE